MMCLLVEQDKPKSEQAQMRGQLQSSWAAFYSEYAKENMAGDVAERRMMLCILRDGCLFPRCCSS
jgi:hypothetical protein